MGWCLVVKIKEHHKNYGRFRISMDTIDTEFITVCQVFKKLDGVVVEATAHYQTNSIEYIAISSLFEKIEQHEMPPLYNIEVSKKVDGSINLGVSKA